MALYLQSHQKGILNKRISTARARLMNCTLCPRNCLVNRSEEKSGFCKTGDLAKISSYGPHYGEESPLVGSSGSGTIFFTHCNMLCNFCQNFDISHFGNGREVTDPELGSIMLDLQERGCVNINLVTPSHVIPQILSGLKYAIEKGLEIPIVYNTGGYDSVDSLQLLEGIVDIYMPDLKFLDPGLAGLYELPEDYPVVAREAILEMHRQVGDLKLSPSGVAESGLLVRYLVMPEADHDEVMEFLANQVSQNTYINVMSQYRPCFNATGLEPINRPITREEFLEAKESARRNGLHRLDR